ncbi:MAG: hypothetical protein AB1468_03505 [Candidatus Micrarchaeota archaeon]
MNGKWEATVSARGEMEERKTGDKGKAINVWTGVQVKKGRNILSIGGGGHNDLKVHFRRLLGPEKKTKFDFYYEKKWGSITRKADRRVGVGVARGF